MNDHLILVDFVMLLPFVIEYAFTCIKKIHKNMLMPDLLRSGLWVDAACSMLMLLSFGYGVGLMSSLRKTWDQ
jgi:hypothetical protein